MSFLSSASESRNLTINQPTDALGETKSVVPRHHSWQPMIPFFAPFPGYAEAAPLKLTPSRFYRY
jgi:hypothetical protein